MVYTYDIGRNSPGGRHAEPRATRVILTTTGDPLTLAEAKDELGIIDTGVAGLDADTDARVSALLPVVREWIETATYRTVAATSTRELYLDKWPTREQRLSDPPLISVAAVKYYDADDAEQTLPTAEYDVLTPTDGPGRVVWRPGFTRPTLSERADAITIEYTAGYGDVADIPPAAKQAARLMLTYYWDDDTDAPAMRAYEQSALALVRGLMWGDYA